MNLDISLFSSLFFLFGLFIGSFLNVLSDRIPRDESFIFGHSYCEECKHHLSPFDLIPLFSFLFLKGRCRYCKKAFSLYYPFAEFVTGLLFLCTYLRFHDDTLPMLVFSLFIVSSLVVLFSSDLKYGILPDKVLLPATAVCVIFYGFIYTTNSAPFLFSALGAGGFFLALFLGTKGKGMGFGDVKLAFFMGLLLGFPGIVYALYIAFLTGAVLSFILILWKKKQVKSTIPFGPFLVSGTLLVLLFPNVIQFFVRMILP